ncbi:MAG: M60 family metallopeptidase, partial [Verrucomicrobia bacterium]|nr:M60 family metallopeptidase [Verrucomicrobiota bacterium]
DVLLRPRLTKAVASLETPYPAAGKPVRPAEVLRRVATAMSTVAAMEAAADAVRAHPTAAWFPGAVAPSAARMSRELVLDLRKPGWASTGLYAAPGERIAVTVPGDLASRRLRVRIGAHSDRLWHLDSWKRCPDITRTFPVTAARTAAANAFGGLVYIESPGGVGDGASHVGIGGAVEAPLFVRGRTTAGEWKALRDRPAPWGELATDRVILTVPSDRLRTLDDPGPLLEVWDRILDADADLAGIPRARERPERIVPDVQISAGYMHSGYPIMTLDDQYDILVSRDALLKGQWGLFHEVGHNHQQRDWTFDGAGEVTVNLFSLYVLETVCGKPAIAGHDAIAPAARARAWARYAAAGRKFDDWKKDPFLALHMYAQLREAFGWDAFKKVFAAYRDLPAGERPRSDGERRDQWMVRFSRAVGRNLGPFFEAWGVPTSHAARDSIASLPAWMPDGWPPTAPAGGG